MGDQGIQKIPGGIQIFRPGWGGTAGKKDRISDDFPYQMDHLTNRFGISAAADKEKPGRYEEAFGGEGAVFSGRDSLIAVEASTRTAPIQPGRERGSCRNRTEQSTLTTGSR